MVTVKKPLFYGWIVAGACFTIATLIFGSLFTFGVFLVPFQKNFGWTTAGVSGAYSLGLLNYTVFGMLSGWGVDRYGPRKTVIAGAVFIALGLVSASRISTICGLYLAYVLIGVGASAGYAPLTTTVSRWFSRHRGLALGIYSSGLGFGPLLAAPVLSHIIGTSGWRSAYLFLAATTIIIIAAAVFLKKGPAQIREVSDGISENNNVTASSPKKRREIIIEDWGLTLRQAMVTRTFWLLASMYLMTGISIQMVMAHIVAYGINTGMSPIRSSTVLSAISGTSIAGRLVMGTASDWIGRKRALTACLATEGVMIFWLAGSSHIWMLFLFGVVFGFAYGGHATVYPALVGEILGLRHMGKIIGVIAFFWGIGGAFGPFLAGYLLDTTGSYARAFQVGAMGMLIAGILSMIVKKPISVESNA
ncbi:MAG: MFS transporter [Deltaproteobacteria bacterium]|nr:MFS transporter [Deltaproteobacteria bacterium]